MVDWYGHPYTVPALSLFQLLRAHFFLADGAPTHCISIPRSAFRAWCRSERPMFRPPSRKAAGEHLHQITGRFNRREYMAHMYVVPATKFTAKGTIGILVKKNALWDVQSAPSPTAVIKNFPSCRSLFTSRKVVSRIVEISYHPNHNGGIGQVNHTMVHMLGMSVHENQDDWETHLPYVEFAHEYSRQYHHKFSSQRGAHGPPPSAFPHCL